MEVADKHIEMLEEDIAEDEKLVADLEMIKARLERRVLALAALVGTPPKRRVRKPRIDKGVVKAKRGVKIDKLMAEAIEAATKKERAPVGSPEVLTEPGAEEVAPAKPSF
jgi:hypothetical protein